MLICGDVTLFYVREWSSWRTSSPQPIEIVNSHPSLPGPSLFSSAKSRHDDAGVRMIKSSGVEGRKELFIPLLLNMKRYCQLSTVVFSLVSLSSASELIEL